MFAWMWYAAPSKEELAKQKREKDSLALVQERDTIPQQVSEEKGLPEAFLSEGSPDLINTDSIRLAELRNKYDVFAGAAEGTDSVISIENELMTVHVSRKGGRICSVVLKDYVRFDSTPLELFSAEHSDFSLMFDTERNRTINTSELFFVPEFSANGSTLAMRAYAGAPYGVKSKKYLEFNYSLSPGSHMMDFKVKSVGLQDIIATNLNELALHWSMRAPSQEKDIKTQQQVSTIYFKYLEDAPDYLSEMKDESRTLDAKVKWIAFKQNFFTSVIIADEYFDKTGADISASNSKEGQDYVKDYSANLTLPYDHKASEVVSLKHYFGPNHFQTLKKFDLDLEKQIPLGWGIFGWVNRFLVIPIFNFLDSFNWNYGIIILCLTLIIKALLFPIAYKTYTSSAKMRVLKPEIDELNTKYSKDDPMKKQQAMMALYRKAGVNPLAGCIPALLQMPILFALFRFFPASIELRQQGFWWVHDLSTYDSVWEFGKLPVIDFIYGDHISVWAILCTITTLIYTQMNSQLMSGTGQQQMPGMKYMMYLMPLFFLPFLNKFSAGLSYYYTLANLISFGQMFVIRSFVDEKKLRAKIEEHKKKPDKGPSSFQKKLQKRMEDLQKQRAVQAGGQRKKR